MTRHGGWRPAVRAGLVLALASALLASCAVATIDVDVYKGPLANERRVQVEQMAVMVVGAKPLLIRLRDGLEENARTAAYTDGLDDRFVCPGVSHGKHNFKNWNARYVNAILSLYENRNALQIRCQFSSPEVLDDLERFKHSRELLQRFRREWQHYLSPIDDYRDLFANIYREIPLNDHINRDSSSTGLMRPDVRQDAPAYQEAVDAVKVLAEKYRLFLGGEDGDPDVGITFRKYQVRDIFVAYEKIRKLPKLSAPFNQNILSASEPAPETGLNTEAYSNRKSDPQIERSIDELSKKEMVKAHARLLFPDKSEYRAMFVQKVMEKAQRYRTARKALHELMRLNLSRLIVLDGLKEQNQAAFTPQQEFARRRMIELTAHLIDRSKLLAVIKVVNVEAGEGGRPCLSSEDWNFIQRKDVVKFRNLGKKLYEYPGGFHNVPISEYLRFLKDQLVKNPKVVAQALLLADELYQCTALPVAALEDGNQNNQSGQAEQNTSANQFVWDADVKVRQYGLSRALSLNGSGSTDAEVVSVSTAQNILMGTNPSSGFAGLDEGRLDAGLIELIEQYLLADDASPRQETPEDQDDLYRLTKGLVHFAQKILFVANNDSLFRFAGAAGADGSLTDVALVLQSIGNAILVAADEIHVRDAHDAKLAQFAADNEVEGLRHGLDRGGASYLDGRIRELERERAAKLVVLQGARKAEDLAKTREDQARKAYRQALGKADDDALDLDPGKPHDVAETAPDGKTPKLAEAKAEVARAEQRLAQAISEKAGIYDAHAAVLGKDTPANPDYRTGAQDALILKEAVLPDLTQQVKAWIALDRVAVAAEQASLMAQEAEAAVSASAMSLSKVQAAAGKAKQLAATAKGKIDVVANGNLDEAAVALAAARAASENAAALAKKAEQQAGEALSLARMAVVDAADPDSAAKAHEAAAKASELAGRVRQAAAAAETAARATAEKLHPDTLDDAKTAAAAYVAKAGEAETKTMAAVSEAVAAKTHAGTAKVAAGNAASEKRNAANAAKKTGADVLAAMAAALKDRLPRLRGAAGVPSDGTNETPQIKVLASAEKWLHDTAGKADSEFAGIVKPDAAQLYAAVGLHIGELLQQVQSLASIAGAQKQLNASKALRDLELERLDGLRTDARKAAEAHKEAVAATAKAAGEVDALAATVALLRGYRDGHGTEIESLSGGEVLANLRIVAAKNVAAAKDALSDAEAKKDAQDVIDAKQKALDQSKAALAQVSGWNPPLAADAPQGHVPRRYDRPPRKGQRENAKDVLDRMVALLREEHIQAARQFGDADPRTKNLKAALDIAYEHRAGLAYLRPASAYLRTVFTATGLQDNTPLAWRNRLKEQALRSVPLVNLLVEDHDSGRQKVIADIDKQFWQNINRVRVAGAGATNYVLAKDDIGNWYVKGYSANPKTIIKSASALAKFTIGSRLGTDLLNRPDSGQDGQASTAQRSRLEQTFDEYTQTYATDTDSQFTDVRALLSDQGLPGQVKAALAQIAEGTELSVLQGAVDHAAGRLDSARQALAADTGSDADRGKRADLIVQALRGVRRFHGSLLSALTETKLSVEAGKHLTEAEAARQSADDALRTAEQKKQAAELENEPAPQKAEKVKSLQGEVDAAKATLKTREQDVVSARSRLAESKSLEARARKAASEVVLDAIESALTRREQTVQAYQNAIGVLGRITGPSSESAKANAAAPGGGPPPPPPLEGQ